MSKLFIYQDKEGSSRIWQKNFLQVSKEMGLSVVTIPFDSIFDRPKSPGSILRKIRKKYRPGDRFVARFNERRESAFKPIYPELETIFGPRNIFPDRLAVDLYNNKRKQAEYFNGKGYPTPAQAWVETRTGLDQFMRTEGLDFPIVRKESHGAASVGVSLISDGETTYPFVAQEFCAENSGDIRIMVVGRKVFGFARSNREDDFRASGSGKIDYVEELPLACVETAYQISEDCGFVCMAYDFILNNQGRWVVAEISYTFVSEPPTHCQYYYDAGQGFARQDRRVGSVERLIIEHIMVTDQ